MINNGLHNGDRVSTVLLDGFGGAHAHTGTRARNISLRDTRTKTGRAGREKKKELGLGLGLGRTTVMELRMNGIALPHLPHLRHPSLSGATEGGERRRGKMRD